MRIFPIINQTAGEEDRSDEIRHLIKAAGHKLYANAQPDLEQLPLSEVDMVVVAGGDGTVTEVARKLVGHQVPLTILPIGTANNLAHSLGIDAEPKQLVAGWERGELKPLDALVTQHPKGRELDFESTGFGIFTEAMCLAKEHSDSGEEMSPEERFDRDFRLLRRLALDPAPWPCLVEVDGKTSEDQVLLCEIMNTRRIGSRLVLAPDADPGDGWLDLVLVTSRDHPLLQRFLEREHSEDHLPHLPVRRCKQLRLTSHAVRIHVGDQIVKLPTDAEPWVMDVGVLAGAVRVLVP